LPKKDFVINILPGAWEPPGPSYQTLKEMCWVDFLKQPVGFGKR